MKTLFVYSIKVSYLRHLYRKIPGIGGLLPVHTFATIGDHWRTESQLDNGVYWYSAGDFCASNEEGIHKELVDSDFCTEVACCLVPSNIEYWGNEHNHGQVIFGRYGVHFVCHNITNRVLSVVSPNKTLLDLDIDLTLYKAVLLTHGKYGRNTKEWEMRQENCKTGEKMNDDDTDREVEKLHAKTLIDITNPESITAILKEVDDKYKGATEQICSDFASKRMTENEFNYQSALAIYTLLKETEALVGIDITKRIHGYSPEEFSDNTEFSFEEINTTVDSQSIDIEE